ncbi:MAG TPA: hypothetical protein VH702_15525 [Vicinamibacterales bacterium]
MAMRNVGLVGTVLVTTLTIAIPALTLAQRPDEADPATRPSRTQHGQPDLQGVWQVLNSAAWDIQDHPAQLFPGLPPRFGMPAGQGVVEGGTIPYQPEALIKKKQNYENRMTGDPEANCYLPGVPRITYMPYPFQIFQFSDRVVILYEYLHATRVIYLDGSPHPKGPLDLWLGDSRGRWEGDTLVVDVIHFTDQTWLDRAGNFHSEALHVIERYTRTDTDHLLYEVTLEDPKVFTRPWKMSMPLYRRLEARSQLLEFECYAYAREGADTNVK